MECPFENRFQFVFHVNSHFLNFAQQMILNVALWLFSHGDTKIAWTQNCKKILEQLA